MSMDSNAVQLFIPCYMDMFCPDSAVSVIKLLESIGDKVIYPEEQTCCGFHLYNEGAVDYAKSLAHKLIQEFNPKLYTIVPSTADAGFIRKHYQKLLENIHVPGEIKNFTSNCIELCDYIVNVKKITKLGNSFNKRVFYFKSCAARNLYELGDEPEILLRNTIGLDLLLDESPLQCCAANSVLPFQNSELSNQLLEEIVKHIYDDKGAQYVTSTDIHCLQHLDAYIQSKGISGLAVMPIGDILIAQE